jgi:hypothetical protein
MSPLAFVQLFGNKDTENWLKFWMFVKKIHSFIVGPTKTILTDQDKGSIAAIEEKLPQAALLNFTVCFIIVKTLSRNVEMERGVLL